MKKFLVCICFLLFLALRLDTHPLKMAYTSVKYNSGKGVFEVSHTIFQDDFEYELQNRYKFAEKDVYKTREEAETRNAFINYFEKNFNLSFNGIKQKLKYKEVEDKGYMGIAVWFETEKVNPETIKTVTVFNTILTTSFKDQVNMFHLNINDKVKRTLKFDRKKSQDSLTL